MAAFDLAGRKLWSRNLGLADNQYGHAASLITFTDKVLVPWDQGTAESGKSALLALDAASGKELWRVRRPVGASWSSPIIIPASGGPQLITSADPWVIAYDPEKGTELWRAQCMSGDAAPSPTFASGTVFVCNDRADLAGINPDGRGDVSKSHVLWTFPDNQPDIVSPLATDRFVFTVLTYGLVTCVDGKTGKKIWEHELGAQVHASPIVVGDLVYLLDKAGTMHIFRADERFKEVAACPVGEPCNATPAIVGGRIYIRTDSNLYCIGSK
jgi:outer membrane protein assembly factor BamB